MKTDWASLRKILDVPCTIDFEESSDSLHVYVELEGVEVGPGDEVVVHDVPPRAPFGMRAIFKSNATIRRAGPAQRLRAYIEGYLELTELYEVSFSDGRAP